MNSKIQSRMFLNVGCGERFHPNWVNIDFVSNSPAVQAHNLLNGIPYPNNTFDVVYHSHALEHFTKTDAEIFMKECNRVLKPGGVIRIAVPNLEVIAKNYVKFLELAVLGSHGASANYDWTMLELYDQTVRTRGGGEMKKYYKQENISNSEFVKERMGHFFELMTRKDRPLDRNGWKNKVKKIIPVDTVRKTIQYIKNHIPGEYHRKLGRFRTSGEIHQWMYDRFSLHRLLEQTGFKEITQREAITSSVKDWSTFNLDSESDGSIYKPDSIFMEAIK